MIVQRIKIEFIREWTVCSNVYIYIYSVIDKHLFYKMDLLSDGRRFLELFYPK